MNPIATPASAAVPPASSIFIPTAEASQCVDATMPKVPKSSGRVLKSMAAPFCLPNTPGIEWPMRQRNISDTDAYTPFDHFFVGGVRSLSRVIGMKRLTKPFWNRWRAGDIHDDVLFDFLSSIKSLDDWPSAAEQMVRQAQADLAAQRGGMRPDEEIATLRRLS